MANNTKTILSTPIWASYATFFLFFLVLAILVHKPQKLEQVSQDALYKQRDQPIEARLNDLMVRMSLEEKIGQMALVDKNSLSDYQDVAQYGLGAVLSGAGAKPENNTPEGWLDMVSEIKDQTNNSRLAIPLLFGVDANHGHGNVPGATIFPHNIGLGASSSEELVKKVAQATSKELQATGVNWTFSPTLDSPEDIRWGRVYESFSSNPELNSRLGSAFVKGTQENSPNILASAKHYLANGSMLWGSSKNKNFKIDQGVVPATHPIEENYFLPFNAAATSEVASIMVGLNFYGDERVIDNKSLVNDRLKEKQGFKGFVVSDWYGIYEFSGVSNYEATVKTINSGVDMAMLPFDYKKFVYDARRAVRNGAITPERIDDAVSRILRQKFIAGLFDETSQLNNLNEVGSRENRNLARQAVASSAVLLKNQNSLLPLTTNQTILLAGSGADNVGRQVGAWTVEWQGIDGNWLPGSTSIYKALQQSTSDPSNVKYKKDGDFSPQTKSEVGIVIISEEPYAEGWGDKDNPTISTEDVVAINNLKAHSNQIIIIVISGRPLLISQEIKSANAVVAAWLPGSEGSGLADLIFGDRPFTAKLPIDWPDTLNQLPIKTDGSTNDGSAPLFRRGFGLSTK